MKHPLTFTLLFCLLFNTLIAQISTDNITNLVVNPSFEKVDKSKDDLRLTNDITSVQGWTSPNNAEPKLYATTDKGYIYDPYGASWNFKARTGKHVATMNVKGIKKGTEHREYIQGSLKKPLEVGKNYDFSFWVHYHCEGANNIGIAFLKNNIKLDKEGLIDLKPATYQKEVTPFDKTTWTQVSGSFVAYEPLQYFIIGNFFNNDQTKGENGLYDHYLAYVDDIMVKESSQQQQINVQKNEKEAEEWSDNSKKVEKLLAEKVAVEIKEVSVEKEVEEIKEVSEAPRFLAIPNLNFEQGSSQLTALSLESIKVIVEDLKAHPTLKIRIIGHASTEGSTAINLKISENRCNQVKAYLLQQGIPTNQISTEALGEAQPFADNSTKEGRAQNRRVEIERFYTN